MKRLLTALALLFPCIVTFAQFSDSIHHKIVVKSTGSFNKTDDGLTYLFNNGVNYSYQNKDFTFNSNAAYVYGNTPEQLTNNDFSTSVNFNYDKKTNKIYYWGLVNFTSSYSLKVKEQLQSGVGAAYKFIENKKTYFAVSDGFLYERSNIIQEDETDLGYQTIRNSFRVQFSTQYKELLNFKSVGFYQPSLTYGGDFIINANATLGIKVWKWLNFTTSVTYNNVSRTQRENLLFTYGLVAEHFF